MPDKVVNITCECSNPLFAIKQTAVQDVADKASIISYGASVLAHPTDSAKLLARCPKCNALTEMAKDLIRPTGKTQQG